ncbi:hypothetical protein GCM10010300_23200 [Streptomyces olivaceoviridis]|nr:hypothetical protein GCM10010300_23200 [Streptomyces olivaceoviridis]
MPALSGRWECLDLDYDALEIPADPGLIIVAYTLSPKSAHADVFRRLRERTAAPEPVNRART